MVGRAVRRGGCSTSVCWHLLSSSKRRMADAACQAALIPLCRLAPPSTCLVWLGRGHEGDHHRDPQFTDCVRMVLLQHCYCHKWLRPGSWVLVHRRRLPACLSLRERPDEGPWHASWRLLERGL